ncbi:MAG: hypothetical protein AB7O38_23325 [Pirellulaceae bacterium]
MWFAPIEYSKAAADNCITRLQQQLERGETEFDYDERLGYLKSLLAALQVPVESQMLVFSKTSLQRNRISPRTPRAIYFSDEVYIGFCQSGDVLEISAVDPKLGTVFYTLDQHDQKKPRFTRQTDSCLICHSSSRTDGVPGHVVRSLFVDPSGQPILSAGSNTVDHTTPMAERWGGWYVTGEHGDQKHLGNLVIRGRDVPRPVENDEGLNVTELADRFAVDRYLSPHSDIVALMVLEHQALVHNRLTKAGYAVRQALHYEAMMNKALGEPSDHRLDSTTRRIQGAGDDLVEALLMVDEAELTAPNEGASGFATNLSQRGPRDHHGRSLRDFDLRQRMFKYPCSYLIYSRAFDELPDEMRDYVWRRLWQVLAENEDPETFAHLTVEDKRAIVEIIRQTKDGLPQYWKADNNES